MGSRPILCTLFATICAAPVLAQGRERDWKESHDPAQGYRWEDEAKQVGLSEEDIATLGKGKVLVTNEAFKQVFQPYLESNATLFITSDSLLNAFHVLYEESILHLEEANARRLLEILGYLWGKLAEVDSGWKGRPELVSAAKRRAQGVIGTAMIVLGMELRTADAELMNLVQTEAARVTKGEGTSKPEWLGPPEPGFLAIDYTRYVPRGFYTRSAGLQKYFRAVSWLQSIPFRPSREEELLSIFMLGECLNSSCGRNREVGYERLDEYARFFGVYSRFVGAGDDWDACEWSGSHSSEWDLLDLEGKTVAEALGSMAKRYLEGGEGPQINDQVRFAPESPGQPVEPSFRVLAAHRTPDAVLFQRTTGQARSWPTGLEVCVALGSGLARDALGDKDREKLLQAIDAAQPLFQGRSLYLGYLGCLRALVDPPEPDAPPFLSGTAWAAKSCQTVLAGWAQLRHTWALQAKQTIHYLGLTMKPPGLVEPDPEFFSRMANLTRTTREALEEAEAFETDLRGLAGDVRTLAELLETKDFAHSDKKALSSLTEGEKAVFERTSWLAECLVIEAERSDKEAYFAEIIAKLRSIAEELEAGRMPDLPGLERAMASSSPRALWDRLEEVCRRLEVLAHKQLRKVRFSAEEDRFLENYGALIAGIMLYGGNSYLTPRDDAPRVVDVFSNPTEGKVLEVGIGRPHAIWVLYPVEGGELLCKGAVLPYYEFQSDTRLTDADWKALLDSDGRPAIPSWISPIVGKDGITPEKLQEGH